MQSNESGFQQCIQDSTLELRSKNDYGTGFFVAPGLILTCNHVLGDTNESKSEIKAVWKGKEFAPRLIGSLDDLDIALLSIDLEDHPCTFLDHDEVAVGQSLYAYGYPENNKTGDCVAPVAEGLSELGRFLTLKDANIRRGFSGSPLINTKTKAVCGMIAIRRERTISVPGIQVLEPIGGRAVPAGAIVSNWSELVGKSLAVQNILELKAISQLGVFIQYVKKRNENLVTINPWADYNSNLLPVKSDLKNTILEWARKLHFSFLSLEIKRIETFLQKVSIFPLEEKELHKYFCVEKSDLRFEILKQFSGQSYKSKAPFEHCAYFFLFLSTNNCEFLDMVNSELTRQRFTEFVNEYIIEKMAHIYV
ncbi:serine protease [Trichocoleus sp. FACHB-262]|uniref:S1 family peptidase n=1 Tax=Trichocoleus sp. FACHB-262 TaxID=2692869 RepID=UPI001687D9D4|nr:serine protease [Trichocoleus sp. FACHB-262]MBD2124569.1 trypsin-like peptidase domain-containing protein [Trichocoleus sp. FACHB-262]